MKKVVIKVLGIILGLAVLGGVIGTTTLIYFSFSLPKISTLADYNPPIPSKILAKDGTVLADIGTERREIVAIEDIPKRIIDAFLSAEDDGFYDHTGVDYMGVLRAMLANLKAGKVVQGGSTITQQVAKSLLLSRERSISRKIKDFLLAQKIEERFTKQEILFLYLNQVYLGGGYYGVKSAFSGYFGKELKEATVAESAIVAGLLVAPGRYSPYVNAKMAKARQDYVLKRMHTTGKITDSEYQEALKEKIKFRTRLAGEFKAGYFTEWVRQRVIASVGEEKFLNEGFTIQTTLDWELQQVAEKEVLVGVDEIDKRQGYKGPLRTIDFSKLTDINKKFREEFYKDKSLFFTLTDEFQRQYEIHYSDDELLKIDEYEQAFNDVVKRKKFQSGYYKEDQLIQYLDNETKYEAVVLSVDDFAKIIYVSIGGVKGVIPYSGFRWAHERKIQEEKYYWGYVRKPSTILKSGDVIKVRIKDKTTTLYKMAETEFVNSLKNYNDKVQDELKKQIYLHCELEQDSEVQGALVSMNPYNGEIISFVGGVDFNISKFNRAIQSKRQPGSAFKPLLFAAALENGYTPSSIIIDSPETLGGVDSSLNWKPRNYDGKYKGPITFRNALEQSRNVPTIKIADDLGVPLILDFSERIGFNAKLDEDLSLALGSFGVTLMDIVKTYAIFPNGGKKIEPISILSIVDRFGNQFKIEEEKQQELNDMTVPTPTPTVPEENVTAEVDSNAEVAKEEEKKINPFLVSLGGTQVYDPRLSYIMTNLLRGVVLHGTGRSAKEVSTYLGGKTGTTNNYVDAWFLGFSPSLVTGVWTGFDENQTLGYGETGARSSLPIWKEYMRSTLKKYGENEFKAPIGIINVRIDKETGEPVENRNANSFIEAFAEGTEVGANSIKSKNDDEKSNGSIFEEDDYYNNQ